MTIQTCWELGQRWYSGRLERDWVRPDAATMQEIFTSLGLVGPFWDVGQSG